MNLCAYVDVCAPCTSGGGHSEATGQNAVLQLLPHPDRHTYEELEPPGAVMTPPYSAG